MTESRDGPRRAWSNGFQHKSSKTLADSGSPERIRGICVSDELSTISGGATRIEIFRRSQITTLPALGFHDRWSRSCRFHLAQLRPVGFYPISYSCHSARVVPHRLYPVLQQLRCHSFLGWSECELRAVPAGRSPGGYLSGGVLSCKRKFHRGGIDFVEARIFSSTPGGGGGGVVCPSPFRPYRGRSNLLRNN